MYRVKSDELPPVDLALDSEAPEIKKQMGEAINNFFEQDRFKNIKVPEVSSDIKKEIIELSKFVSYFRASAPIDSFTGELRGEVVPILDIRIKFNTGEVIYDVNTSVIAVITEDKRMVGIIVDKVDDVQRLDITTLAPVSDMGSAIPSKYLKGFVRLSNNEMLVVMDIEAVVHKNELKD